MDTYYIQVHVLNVVDKIVKNVIWDQLLVIVAFVDYIFKPQPQHVKLAHINVNHA